MTWRAGRLNGIKRGEKTRGLCKLCQFSKDKGSGDEMIEVKIRSEAEGEKPTDEEAVGVGYKSR